jgi:hypothetical protein
VYPKHELARLALRREHLRREIARDRIRCVAAAASLAEPLLWFDRLRACWRSIRCSATTVSPTPWRRWVGYALRWGPLVLGAFRGHRRK